MDLIIDANVLFAALIKNNSTAELIFKFRLYAPEFIFVEFNKYKEYLINKSNRTKDDFDNVLDLFERYVILVPLEEISLFIEMASKISPDEKDVPYIALALKKNCPIWSQDKALKEKQNVVKVYTTEELVKIG